MPRLSDSMTEGTVVRWLRAPGDAVRRGDPIVEIETDKATITYEADLDGVIAQILVGEGQTVPVGTTIATIEQAGAAPTGVPAPLATPAAPPPLPTPDAPAPLTTPGEAVEYEIPAESPTQYTGDEPQLQPASESEPQFVEPLPAPPAEPALPEPTAGEAEGRVKASPIARRLARKLGVDLTRVTGTGPGGRIVKEDVEAAASAQAGGLAEQPPPPPPLAPPPEPAVTSEEIETFEPQQPEVAAPEPPPPAVAPVQGTTGAYPPVQPGVTGGFAPVSPPVVPGPPIAQPPGQQPPGPPIVPGAQPGAQAGAAAAVGATATRGQSTVVDLSQPQQVVARRMAEAKATVPEFQVEVDVDMSAATALREQLRYGAQPAPSINDLVIKASAMALRQFPRVNGAYRDAKFEYYTDVNVGVVVSAGDLLAVPTLFNADQKGLAQIARESHELAAAVRNRTIQPAQLAGGTFTISNLGMFGVPRFNAIINPPQAAILAVGAIQRKPVVADDGYSLQVRPVMTLTLSVDHRIVYGQEAAEFAGAIKSWLENPHALQM